MKVAVLTTSYPREPGDPAGNFVADAVEWVRGRGVEVEVVSPASFRHFGIAYGAGVVGNLRRQPWRAAFVPPMLGSFALAGTLVANAFYLTMSFYYFFAFAALVLAANAKK